MQIAQRLIEQRRKHKKTQKEIADVLNVNRATYGLYENGTNNPPIEKLIAIADYFGVSIDYLCGREMVPNEFLYQKLTAAREMCAALENTIEDVLNNGKTNW